MNPFQTLPSRANYMNSLVENYPDQFPRSLVPHDFSSSIAHAT